MTPSQCIGITSDEIASVVKRFYEQVRQDPGIGPVFKHTVGTSEQVWAHDEEKISAFGEMHSCMRGDMTEIPCWLI